MRLGKSFDVDQPENELGVPVPLQEWAILVRTDQLVVAVTRLTAFSTGFVFDLAIRTLFDLYRREPFQGFDQDFRVGVAFASGSSGFWAQPPDGVFVSRPFGGGSDRSVDFHVWVSPLPPGGPITFSCEWPAHDIDAHVQVIDGDEIRTAAGRVERLWRPRRRA